MGLGVGDTSVGQPDVQLVEVLEPKLRREEPIANQTDLVLDLSLLPPDAGVQATGSTR